MPTCRSCGPESSLTVDPCTAAEKRRDAQVAREIEVGLSIELNKSEHIALLRDFARREFVKKGMVADR
jgi:hypothetical protein